MTNGLAARFLRQHRLYLWLYIVFGNSSDGAFCCLVLLGHRSLVFAGGPATFALVATCAAWTLFLLRLVTERGQVAIQPVNIVADHLLNRAKRLHIGFGDDRESLA